MKTATICDLSITEIVVKKSPYDEFKMELKQHIVEFSEQYPLSSEENMNAYIDSVLRKNYAKLLRVIPEKGSAWYHFSRLQIFLRGASKRTVKKVLEFYENQYMALLEEELAEKEMMYYHNVREPFIMEGLRQD